MQISQEQKNQSAAHKVSTPQSDLLEIKRDFNNSVDELFKAFTTAEALKMWWWPKHIHADHIEIDFREGGKYFISMKGIDISDGGMTGHI